MYVKQNICYIKSLKIKQERNIHASACYKSIWYHKYVINDLETPSFNQSINEDVSLVLGYWSCSPGRGQRSTLIPIKRLLVRGFQDLQHPNNDNIYYVTMQYGMNVSLFEFEIKVVDLTCLFSSSLRVLKGKGC